MTQIRKISNELLEFYRKYPIDHWIYKVIILKNVIDNYDSVKELLLKDLKDVVDEDCINVLKAEIHFTYFQMVEALFELIFALEKKKDKLLWLFLTISPFRMNFRRITKIAKGNTDFLDKRMELPSGKKISLIQYIFYFGADFPISGTEMKSNLENIKEFLILIAKDFSDRRVYNSYKHSLRFYQSPAGIELGEILDEDKINPILKVAAEDTFSFLFKNKEGNVELRIKAFDYERDINMINFSHNLIQNIINLRKRYFFTRKEKAKAWMFNKIDLEKLNESKYNLIELKSVIFWKKLN